METTYYTLSACRVTGGARVSGEPGTGRYILPALPRREKPAGKVLRLADYRREEAPEEPAAEAPAREGGKKRSWREGLSWALELLATAAVLTAAGAMTASFLLL